MDDTKTERERQAILTSMILVMLADDKIAPRERMVLEKMGRQIGAGKKEIDALTEHPEKLRLVIPKEEKGKVRQLVAMIAMMRADGEIDARERDLCTRFALAIGMPPLKVSKVIAAAEQGMRKGQNYDQISKDISLTIDV